MKEKKEFRMIPMVTVSFTDTEIEEERTKLGKLSSFLVVWSLRCANKAGTYRNLLKKRYLVGERAGLYL